MNYGLIVLQHDKNWTMRFWSIIHFEDLNNCVELEVATFFIKTFSAFGS